MRNRLWLLTVVWYALTVNMLWAQTPISLQLQSKAGDRITGVIADPIMDSYLNPAMMDFDHLTIFTGARYNKIGTYNDISNTYIDSEHLNVFLPIKSWNVGLMADKKVASVYNEYDYYSEPKLKPRLDDKYNSCLLLLNKKINTRIGIGISFQYLERDNPNSYTYWTLNYTGNEKILDPLLNIEGNSKEFKGKLGGKIKINEKLILNPVLGISTFQKKAYRQIESINNYWNTLSTFEDFYYTIHERYYLSTDISPELSFETYKLGIQLDWQINEKSKSRFIFNYFKMDYYQEYYYSTWIKDTYRTYPQDTIQTDEDYRYTHRTKDNSIRNINVGAGVEFNIFNKMNNYLTFVITNYLRKSKEIGTYKYFYQEQDSTSERNSYSDSKLHDGVIQLSYGFSFKLTNSTKFTYSIYSEVISLSYEIETKNFDCLGLQFTLSDHLQGQMLLSREFFNDPSFISMQFKYEI